MEYWLDWFTTENSFNRDGPETDGTAHLLVYQFYRALKNHHEIEVIQKTGKTSELDLGCIYHFDLTYRIC